MFLQQLKKRNPRLIEAAFVLHRDRLIPPNTFLIDLDTVDANARALVDQGRRVGLESYLMTKHFNRNPLVTAVALRRGFNGVVAVDMWDAKVHHRCGNRVGHLGHLNQIPKWEVPLALAMEPEVMTLFSLHQGALISEAALARKRVQEVLLRVTAPGDVFFPAQEGGFPEEELDGAVRELKGYRGIRIVGVTSFPCLNYNLSPEEPVGPTPNFHTILRAAERLASRHGIEVKQINAPGNNSCSNYPLLKRTGATHVEPGQALLGTTPSHSFDERLAETPSFVYVTEVSHRVGELAYVFGGGFWVGAKLKGNMGKVLAGPGNELVNRHIEGAPMDYHESIQAEGRCAEGDTAVYGFYTQMQMTRAYVAVASGIQAGRPKMEGIFDHASNLLDENWYPTPLMRLMDKMKSVCACYR